LLRVLETGEVHPIGGDRPVPVDVRVVAATWRNPPLEVVAGRFRHDLMHRLCVLTIMLPPLRERRMDVMPLIVEGLAAKGAPELIPEGGLRRLLEQEAWPGNVRELRNRIERAVAYRSAAALLADTGGQAGPRLPRRSVRGTQPGFGVAAPVVQGLVSRTLRHEHGNRVRAARALGVSRSTLYRWMRDLGHVGPGRVDTSPAPTMMTEARKA
jgi:DNA-binding NtrC family response regulator